MNTVEQKHRMADEIDDRIDAEIAVNRAWTLFSSAQLSIAQRLMMGKTPKEIAEDMGISHQAVNSHVVKMRGKIDE